MDADTAGLTGSWRVALLVGLALGVLVAGFAVTVGIAARRVGETWFKGTSIAGVVAWLFFFRGTHPRGEDAIGDWGRVEWIVAIDVTFVVVVGYGAWRRWSTPVLIVDEPVGSQPPRHGRRWRRRSAARRTSRPGGR